MMKKILTFIIFFSIVKSTLAVENNKFGIHLAQPHHSDIKKAAEMINSNGGDWGYITLIIQENDRNRQKWQEIFDLLRQYHLIPIIRLATYPEGANWKRPSKEDAQDWADFLDSLNWVVKNRYIVLFNEPNHGAEWGGEVDVVNYAEVAVEFAKKLKEKSPDFFVMLAGFDASSPHQPPKFWDEERFLKELLTRAGDLTQNNNSQENSNHRQSKSNLDISADIPNIKVFHNDSLSNIKQTIRKNIPQKISIVNIQNALGSLKLPKLEVMNAAPSQPAERFIESPASVLYSAFFDFLAERNFIKPILAEEKNSVKKNLFDYIDGWVSHSYPNPGFSGSPWDRGRGTIRSYEWELELLRSLGVTKQLPVFITETGWERQVQSSKLKVKSYLNEEVIADYFKIAFEQVWLPDERVMAVTPFVFDYQGEPFLGFSWKKFQSEDYYPQYYLIQSMPKIKGEPERIEKGIIDFDLPKELTEQSTYQFRVRLKNLGQAIWDKDNSYQLLVMSYLKERKPFDYLFSDLKDIRPFEEAEIDLFLKTVCISCYDRIKDITVNFVLKKNDQEVLKSKDWTFKIIPLPSLKFSVQMFPKLTVDENDFEIQIFDEKEKLVFEKKNIKVKKGKGLIEKIQNIIPGKRYRLVILKPYYLPRQDFLVIHKGENFIRFKKMLPFDFDKNGRFNKDDIVEFFQNPSLIKFLLP